MRILKGERAKAHCEKMLEVRPINGLYTHLTEKDVRGGHWKESEGIYVAFDNSTGDCFVEDFSSEEEALKYASGKKATTKEGFEI